MWRPSSSWRRPNSNIARSSSTSAKRRSMPAKTRWPNCRRELRTTQREVLEMRLATEETWAQLSGALAPASLTRSISQVRAKLADHYRVTLDEMAARSEQLGVGSAAICRSSSMRWKSSGGAGRLGRAAALGYRVAGGAAGVARAGARSAAAALRADGIAVAHRADRLPGGNSPAAWRRFAIWKSKRCGRRKLHRKRFCDRLQLRSSLLSS